MLQVDHLTLPTKEVIVKLADKLNRYTGLSHEIRTKSLRWLARQPEPMILEAFIKQKEHYFTLSQRNEANKSILYLSSLYKAAHDLYTRSNQAAKKNRHENIDDVEDVTSIHVLQHTKHIPSPKMERMLNLKNKILRLRYQEKMSYRDISDFLRKFHRFEVSHTTIHHFVKQMDETNLIKNYKKDTK